MKLKKQNGQTLIEVLIAMGAGIIVLTAMVGIVIKSLSNSQYGKYQSMANGYAQEGMEVLRSLRDASWGNLNNLQVPPQKYCLPENSTSLILGACNPTTQMIQGVFIREVQRLATTDPSYKCDSGNGGVGVIVTVSWKDAKCTTDPYCNKVRLDSCFYNLKTLPTP